LKGFALSDCGRLQGDDIARTVVWKNASNVSAMAGKPIRLRFQLVNADVYSFHFE